MSLVTEINLELVLTLFIPLVFVVFMTIFIYLNTTERKSREGRKILEGQARARALKLEDLKERRQKYATLVESDIETLLEKRRY